MTSTIKHIIEETISDYGWSCTRDFNNKRLYRFQIKMTYPLLYDHYQNTFGVTIYKPNKTITDDKQKKYSIVITSTLLKDLFLNIQVDFLRYSSYKQIIKKIIKLLSENYEQIRRFYLNIDNINITNKLIKTNRIKECCMTYFSYIMRDFFEWYVNDILCKTTLKQCLNKKAKSNQFNKYILWWFDNIHDDYGSFYMREYMCSCNGEEERLLGRITYYDIMYGHKKSLFI